jgi:hypothetical protein
MLETKTVTNGTPVRGKALLTAAMEKISSASIAAPCEVKWSATERNSRSHSLFYTGPRQR